MHSQMSEIFVPATDPNGLRAYATRISSTTSNRSQESAKGETYLTEAFGLGRFHKVGLVEEVSTGRTWCLQSDEGASLGGTNLAPAPLLTWLAGLQADVALRIAEVAHRRNVLLKELHVGVSQGFASKGSFVKGEAIALIFGLDWDFDLSGPETEQDAFDIVEEALRLSPAAIAMASAKKGRFALQVNGLPKKLEELEAWESPTVVDPLLRYTEMPVPTDELIQNVFTFIDGNGATPEAMGPIAERASDDAGDTAIHFYVDARGQLDLKSRLMRTTTGFPTISSDRWQILTDAHGQVAPKPLAIFAIGAAFCYHTQLSRYVKVRKLDVGGSSLAQLTTYVSPDPATGGIGCANAVLTGIFLNGSVLENEASSLLQVAANTCYVHRALSVEAVSTIDVMLV